MKEEMTEILMKIVSAIKEVMSDGKPTILIFADAEIIIRKRDVEQ